MSSPRLQDSQCTLRRPWLGWRFRLAKLSRNRYYNLLSAATRAPRTFTPIPYKDLMDTNKDKTTKLSIENLKEIGKTKGGIIFQTYIQRDKKALVREFQFTQESYNNFHPNAPKPLQSQLQPP
ncbi:hypothetical protein KQX54_000739 [Cotesia glomerata]|uniref:Uncharacterized protein n=1 Tax=Cotesia glomerata TaxID=32391 RepID=A0AAV7INN9_COTGL|nr:hypothetical protein KQX54_000739 [Cotesia glomerata]